MGQVCCNLSLTMPDTDALNGDVIMVDDDDVDRLVDLGIDLISSILEGSQFEVIKSKIDAGAPLWFQDDDGTSALHVAALQQDEELLKYLISEGAIWNAGW